MKSDLLALEKLKAESSIFAFKASNGNPPQQYVLGFRGKSLSRSQGKVVVREYHEVEVKLGASYPRTMPELRWLTPIYHPNISEIGMVCLGAYGTHWVPSLAFDELCNMLWDMARYQNYDVRSPYNREAALWSANQTAFKFPIDSRSLRDNRVALGRAHSDLVEVELDELAEPSPQQAPRDDSIRILDMEIDPGQYSPRTASASIRPAPPEPPAEVVFLD